MTTETINANLEIVKLGRQCFKTVGGHYKPKGYALYHSELGYFAFEGHRPYTPRGGEEVLQSILDAGGLLNFDTAVWLKEMA